MAGPTVTARIEAVDAASEKLRQVAATAEQIQNTVGRAHGKMASGALSAQAQYNQAHRTFVAAQAEHAAAIDRANQGLLKMQDLLKGIAAVKLGQLAVGGLKEAMATQDQYQRALYAGLTKDEADRIHDIAVASAGKYTMNSVHEGEQTGVELRGVLSKSEDVETALPVAMRAAQALKALGEHAEGLGPLFKAAEMAGVANDPKRLEAFVDSFVRAKSLYHDMITPELYRSTFAASRVSAMTMSDDYRNRVMPLLIAEMNQGAGVGQNMVMKQAVGGFAGPQHAALKTWVDLGLINKDDVEYNKKTGEAQKLKTGAKPLDIDLMQSDLQKYVGQDFLPAALKKLKIDSADLFKMDQSEAMRQLSPLVTQAFPNGRAADEVAKVIQGLISGALERHREMLDKSHGLAAADEAMESVSNAMAGMKESATNLLGVLATPVMDEAATAMGAVSRGLGAMLEPLNRLQKAHPYLATGVAGVGVVGGAVAGLGATAAIINKLSGASAIKASAVQLDLAAKALDEAAAVLTKAGGIAGKGKAVGAAENAAEGAAGGNGAAKAESAAAGLASFAGPLAAITATQTAAAIALYERNRQIEASPDGFTIGENGDLIPNPPSGDHRGPTRDYGMPWPDAAPLPPMPAPLPRDYAMPWPDAAPLPPMAAPAPLPPVPSPPPLPPVPAPIQGPEMPRLVAPGFEGEKVADAFARALYRPIEQRLDAEIERHRNRAYSDPRDRGPVTAAPALPLAPPVPAPVIVKMMQGPALPLAPPVPAPVIVKMMQGPALPLAPPVPAPVIVKMMQGPPLPLDWKPPVPPPLPAPAPVPPAPVHVEPWHESTGAREQTIKLDPIKVDSNVSTTVTGEVKGAAELNVHFSSDSIMNGVNQMIKSAINLAGGITGHGNQGESTHVPSPTSNGASAHFGHN